jgi:hypothetical protein
VRKLSSRQNGLLVRKRITILTILSLLVVVTSLPFIVPASASGYNMSAMHANYHSMKSAQPSVVSISMSYSLSRTQIYVTLNVQDSQLPSHVVLSLASTYNGASAPYNVQSVTLQPAGGKVTATFKVPYDGIGNYIFSGYVKTTSGTTILSATIDPRIDPDWH